MASCQDMQNEEVEWLPGLLYADQKCNAQVQCTCINEWDNMSTNEKRKRWRKVEISLEVAFSNVRLGLYLGR
jgi:hypothetical protein